MPHRWCAVAELRRNQIESGVDLTFVDVFKPLFIKLVCELQPTHVIEIGAGTGHLSKAIADKGFLITAIEPSVGMYDVACEVLTGTPVRLINCSSSELVRSDLFDVAFSHLVAHAVEDLAGFLESVSSHVHKGGYFIFSIPHPCFYNDYKGFFGTDYSYMKQLSKEVSFSVTNDPENIITGVPYHHRPLSVYINSINEAGFVLSGFQEAYPPKDLQLKYGAIWEHPRYCTFICKKL